jgi:hypothetical protein
MAVDPAVLEQRLREIGVNSYVEAKKKLENITKPRPEISKQIAAIGYEHGAVIEYSIREISTREGGVHAMGCLCLCACLSE